MRLSSLALALPFAITASSCVTPPDDEQPPELRDKVYVADEESGTISVIDEETLERTATIDLSDGDAMFMPHNVQVAPDGKSVWVTAPPMEGDAHGGEHGEEGAGEEQAIVIDPETDEIVDRIALGAELHVAHVVLDESSENAFVSAYETSEVLHIDAASREVVERHSLGENKKPHGLRACGDRLFIADMDGMALSILDPHSGELEEVALGGVAVQTACTPDGMYAFASLYDTMEVVRYDMMSGDLVRIALPEGSQGPVQLYPSPDSEKLYVCDQGVLLDRPASNRLYVIDVADATVAATVEVGAGAHGVVVNDDGSRAYVTNIVDGTVSVVDTEALETIETIAVGDKPNGISHWHVSGGMP